RLGQDIVYTPDSGLLPRALSLVASTFGYEQVAFLRDDGGVLRVDALAGKPLDGWQAGHALERADGLLAGVHPPTDLAWSNDLSGQPRAPGRSRAEIIVPVRLGSEVLGLLDVRSSSVGAFTQRDPSVLKSVADQLAVALQNQRLLLQAERRAAYLEAVAHIGQEVAAILRTQDLLRQAAESVGRRLDYERVAIFLLDESGATASLVAEHDRGEVRVYDPPAASVRVAEEGPVARAARTGQTVRREGGPISPGFGSDGNLPTRAELCVPIRFRGRVIGILDIGTDREGVFGPDEVGALSLLANLIAAVLENARLYERERATAAELAERNLALVRAQARLVRAERLAAIGQLGLAVKHEINNPLTAILGNTEWLMEQEAGLSEEGRRALKLVHDMSIRVRDIVARLQNVEDVRRPYLGMEMIDLGGQGRGESDE
ncbi:MAG: GAF domain-containing protein, partial [Anaerolineae bacterium]